MESDVVQVLIQAGAVGLALVTLWVLHQTNKDHRASDAALAESITALAESMATQTEVVRSLSAIIDRKL